MRHLSTVFFVNDETRNNISCYVKEACEKQLHCTSYMKQQNNKKERLNSITYPSKTDAYGSFYLRENQLGKNGLSRKQFFPTHSHFHCISFLEFRSRILNPKKAWNYHITYRFSLPKNSANSMRKAIYLFCSFWTKYFESNCTDQISPPEAFDLKAQHSALKLVASSRSLGLLPDVELSRSGAKLWNEQF